MNPSLHPPSLPPSERPIRRLLARLERVRVPHGAPLTFVILASVCAFLLALEALTGVLLALYYRPTLAAANDSVRFVITEVAYGDLIRTAHALTAHALLAALGVTALWTLATRAYQRPNGIAWICGSSLLIVCVAEAFTGNLLPWTRQSVVEAQISAGLVGHLPWVGPWLHRLLLGGDRPGDLALVRILGVHAGALPMAATALFGILTLHAAGSAPSEGAHLPLTPHVALRVTIAWALTAMALVITTAVHPLGLGATAGAAPESAAGVRPPWYLLGLHEALRLAPERMLGVPGVSVMAALLAVFAGVIVFGPAFDRRGSRFGQVLGLVVLFFLAGGTLRAIFL